MPCKSASSLIGLCLVAAACAAPSTATPALASASAPSPISIAVASDDFAVGAPRVPVVLLNGSHPVADAKAVRATAFDLGSGPPAPGWSGDATAYPDYDVPYRVLYPEVPHKGTWGISLAITLADGTQTDGQFTIDVADTTSAPGIGDAPPASLNRTLATEPDLARLTSDPQPDPALYQLTVAEALKQGKPLVVAFATPAFCASRLCGPAVNTLKTVSKQFGGAANFIHIEVYKTFDPLVYADEMAQWGLTSKPWVFVLDKTGKVAARFGGPVSPAELTAALNVLVKP